MRHMPTDNRRFVFAAVLVFAGIGGPALWAACEPPPSGIVSWWPGDADTVSGGTVVDVHDGNDGTLMKGAMIVGGRVRSAFLFTQDLGSGIRVPSSSNLNPTSAITLEAWVRPFSFPSLSPRVFGKLTSADGSTQYNLSLGDGFTAGFVHCNIGNLQNANGGTIPLNQWSHVACTYDGLMVRAYLSGTEVASNSATGSIPTGSRDLWIGREEPLPLPSRQFDGLIDEPRIYGRALTASEIQANFAAGGAGGCRCTGKPSNMVSWWPGDGDAVDVQSGHNGTLQHGASFSSGKVGQAFAFDGVDDYVGNIGEHATYSFIQNTGIFTVMAWVRVNDPDALKDEAIAANTPTTIERGHFFMWEGSGAQQRLRMVIVKGISGVPVIDSVSPDSVISDSAWHHVAAVGDGTEIVFYIDGVAYAGTDSMGSKSTGDSTRVLGIGHCPHTTPLCQFDGNVDELQIYDRALAASEVEAVFDAGRGGICRCSDGDADGYGSDGLSCLAGTAQDCDDGNPLVWLAPTEIEHLTAEGSGPTTLKWISQNGLAGSATTNDVSSADFSASSPLDLTQTMCLQSAGGEPYVDMRSNPAPQTGYWYIVRAQNSCGIGTYGSVDRDASIASCP